MDYCAPMESEINVSSTKALEALVAERSISSHQRLMPFQELISKARSLGVSSEKIAETLTASGTPVTKYGVIRFCQEVLKEKPKRRRGKNPASKPALKKGKMTSKNPEEKNPGRLLQKSKREDFRVASDDF